MIGIRLLDELLQTASSEARHVLVTTHRSEITPQVIIAWDQRADEVMRQGHMEQALRISQVVLETMAWLEGPQGAAWAWWARGHLLLQASEVSILPQAQEALEQALTLFREYSPGSAGHAGACVDLGDFWMLQANPGQALPFFHEAVEIHGDLGPSRDAAYAWARLGAAQKGQGCLSDALISFQKAQALAERLEDQAMVVDLLMDIGLVQQDLGQPSAATASLSQAVVLAEQLGDRPRLARALGYLAAVQQLGLQAYEQALATYRRVIEIAAGPELAFAHIQAASVCTLLERWEEANDHYRNALTTCEQLGHCSWQAACHAGLAKFQQRAGHYNEARRGYEQALALYQAAGELAGVLEVRQELGELAWEWGRPEEALQHYGEALSLAQAAQDWSTAGGVCDMIGTLYKTTLNLPEVAHRYYEQAARHFDRLESPDGRLLACRSRGDLALAEDNPEQAVAWYWKGAEEARHAGDRLSQAELYKSLAQAYAAQRQYEAAVRSQHRAIRSYRQLGLHQQLAQAYVDLARLHSAFDYHGRAIRAYRRGIRLYHDLALNVRAAADQVGLAWEHFVLGRYLGARRILRWAITTVDPDAPKSFFPAYAAYLGLGVVHECLGRSRQALLHYLQAIELVERYQVGLVLPDFKLAFLGNRERLYARTVFLCTWQGRSEDALGYAEASRSRAFLNLLALTPLPLSPGRVPAGQLAEEALWLRRLRGLLAHQSHGEVIPEYLDQVHTAWRHLEEVWRAMGDEEYVALRQGRPTALAELQECLALEE